MSSSLSPSLPGRTVLVTGATSGIGYETARRLAELGATVLVHGRTPEEAQAAIDRLIASAGISDALLRPLAADFARLEEVENLAHAVRHLGPMSQDWKAAFDLGDTDRSISDVDGHGVALVSIQALHRLIIELRDETTALRAEVTELRIPR